MHSTKFIQNNKRASFDMCPVFWVYISPDALLLFFKLFLNFWFVISHSYSRISVLQYNKQRMLLDNPDE